jgi:hypothetical protein
MAQVPGSSAANAAGGQRLLPVTPSAANDRPTGDAIIAPRLFSTRDDETNRSALQAWFAPVGALEAREFGQVTLVRKNQDASTGAVKEEQGREGADACAVLVEITPPPLGPGGSREHYQGRVQSEKLQLKLLAGEGFPCINFEINVREKTQTPMGVTAAGKPPDLSCEVVRERLLEDGRPVQRARLNWSFPVANAVVAQRIEAQWRGDEKFSGSQVTHSSLPIHDSVISQGASANPVGRQDS